MSVLSRRNVLGIGGGGAKIHFKRIQFCRLHYYICDIPYQLSYEPILALLLYTDLGYMSLILNSLIFCLTKYLGGGQLPPPLSPVPTTMRRTCSDKLPVLVAVPF